MYGTLGWPLQRAARMNAEGEAIVDGRVRRTWSEVYARLGALGGSLDRLGICAGDVISVLAHNSGPHLEAWLGIPAHGRVINDLNTRLTVAEQQFMVDDCEPVALMVDDDHLERGRDLLELCRSLRTLVYAGAAEEAPAGTVHWEQLVAGEPAPFPELDEGTLAAIAYTGGTSGRPKGVMLSHRNVLTNAKHFMLASGHQHSDRYLHAAPMYHVADTSQTFAMTWAAGTHVILPAFKADSVAHAIEAERITLMLLVPVMIAMLVDQLEREPGDLSSLRLLMYAASPMPPKLQRRAMAMIDCEFTQLYGMTEAAPLVTQCTPEDHRRGAAGEEPYARRLPSAGAPVVGVQCTLRDPKTLKPVPDGTPGEIWVRGPNVMMGYWHREEETAQALTEDGWYRSGDMAYADEAGYLYIVDRVKDMIITGGENVYCTEVELVFYEHPDVAEVAVFGVPDERWGERVHAAVVLRAGARLDVGALLEHARSRIAAFKAPRSVEIHAEPLPKSGPGKILKRELREPHWAGHASQVH